MSNPYKWLWSHIGGRPWTYIIRDFYHNHAILFIFIEAWTVYLFNKFLHTDWRAWVLISLGVLLGHLFWGTKYIPEQPGEGKGF